MIYTKQILFFVFCLRHEVSVSESPNIHWLSKNSVSILLVKFWICLYTFQAYEKKIVYCEYHYPLTFQEYEAVCFPHRSTTFATNFQHRSLEYCDSITDSDMEDIVTVCRGSLTVIDYYKWVVKHRLLRLNRFEIKGNTKLDVEVDTQ